MRLSTRIVAIVAVLAPALLTASSVLAEAPQTVRQLEPTVAPLTERLATWLGHGDWRRVRVPGYVGGGH